jgi:aspartate carbamoyltransferase regulatory subunit
MVRDRFLEVRAIENGTVIDHIPVDALFKIVNIMALDQEKHRMTIGTNLESDRIGVKAIIKIADRYLAKDEIDRIALVAPNARVNIIKGYDVVEKLHVSLPERIKGVVQCANPHCITNNEPVDTSFDVIDEEGVIELKCRYCEKATMHNEIELFK